MALKTKSTQRGAVDSEDKKIAQAEFKALTDEIAHSWEKLKPMAN